MKQGKLVMIIGSIIMTGSLLASCASSMDNLQRATASKIEGANSSQVSIQNIDRGAMSVTWDATYNGEDYKCNADDMVKRVNCSKA